VGAGDSPAQAVAKLQLQEGEAPVPTSTLALRLGGHLGGMNVSAVTTERILQNPFTRYWLTVSLRGREPPALRGFPCQARKVFARSARLQARPGYISRSIHVNPNFNSDVPLDGSAGGR
jgi:hypothetical protein